MAEGPVHAPDGSERRIGRRAFIGLVAAGLAALFLGREILPGLSQGMVEPTGLDAFFINSVTATPPFDPATWLLRVDGLVRKPLTLSFEDFEKLPQVERTRDFLCVEGWGAKDLTWKGITVRTLLEQADIDPRATHLVFHSGDAVYTDSLTLEESLRSDTLLAHEANGQPLRPDMGLPVRLVVPGKFGYKYVKWVVRVEAIAAGPQGYLGYWEQRGYSADATI